MRKNRPLNIDKDGNARAIRACYSQCGYNSVFIPTGHGITGVEVIDETD